MIATDDTKYTGYTNVNVNDPRCIDICKHAIGLGIKTPYKRHSKLFYKPYRNFFALSQNSSYFELWVADVSII